MENTVVAKFKVDTITRGEIIRQIDLEKDWSPGNLKKTEVRTISMSPVYSPDPNSENKRFWDATPSGKIELGVLNPEAWATFELGRAYYVSFAQADDSAPVL